MKRPRNRGEPTGSDRLRFATRRVICACLLVAFWGCSTVEVPRPLDRPGDTEQSSELDIEALRALGYLDSSDEIVTAEKSGVVHHNPDRAHPGYNLVVTRGICDARLIDNDGAIARQWVQARCKKWANAELTAEGDLFVPGRTQIEGKAGRGFLLRLDWQGEVVWRSKANAHHDVEPGEGESLTLLKRALLVSEIDPEVSVSDNLIALVDTGSGAVRSRLSLYQTLSRNDVGFELEVPDARGEENRRIDMFHANSIERMRRPELAALSPIYALDNVLVSIRHQDSIAIISLKSKRLVWHWGRGEISGPHDASVLDNGNILLFDNGLGREWSRVIELNPLTKEIVWEYHADKREDFYTGFQGSAQRLPNGNTLIAESAKGYAFEISKTGEKVWEYWNPLQKKGRRASIIRVKRYDSSLVEALLFGRDGTRVPSSAPADATLAGERRRIQRR